MATRKRSAPSPKPSATVASGSSSLRDLLPDDWRAVLHAEFDQPYFHALEAFVAAERAAGPVFPPAEDVFNAFKATPFEQVKVLLLGQDPYHGPGQAHGMAFSVRHGVRPPPSLVNMFRELRDDLGVPTPNHGTLETWAQRGVMLLNAVLTVRQGEPNSHKDHGWEKFTDAVIRALNDRAAPVVFVLWGAYAQKKAKLVTEPRHRVVKAAHPSPLSAAKYLGSKPYSAVNQALEEVGAEPIDWRIPARSASEG
ncbi:MAG: uracil-DNA glycosylase [Gemmataceae bacterium]